MSDTLRKRHIPRSDELVTRIDVRIPNPMFEELEKLATERGEPIHHKSGRVTIAPTLLDLLRIGLDHYSPEALERVSAKLSVKQSDTTASDNRIDFTELEDRLFDKLGERLQSLAEELAQKK